MGRGTSLGYLPLLGISTASLEKVEWEVLGEQWSCMMSHRLYKCCTVCGRVPKKFWLCSEEVHGLKYWMLEQPVKMVSFKGVLLRV